MAFMAVPGESMVGIYPTVSRNTKFFPPGFDIKSCPATDILFFFVEISTQKPYEVLPT